MTIVDASFNDILEIIIREIKKINFVSKICADFNLRYIFYKMHSQLYNSIIILFVLNIYQYNFYNYIYAKILYTSF